MAVACMRKQLGNVSAFLLEAERVGVLTIKELAPIRLASCDKGAFDSYMIVAVRTSVLSEAIRGIRDDHPAWQHKPCTRQRRCPTNQDNA